MSALSLPLSVVHFFRARYRASRAGRLDDAAKAVVESLERRQLLSVTSATVTGPSQVAENTTATYELSATDTIGNGTSWSQRQPDGSYSGGIYIPEGKTYDFSYSAGDEGQDTLQFRVTDGGVCCGTGQSDSPYDTNPQSITITDSPISFESAVGGASATEGESDSVFLGVLLDQDPYGGDYSNSTIQWGDGSSSAGQFYGTAYDAQGNPITQGSAFDVYGTCNYAEQGSYTAALSLVDDGGQPASGSTPVTVAEAPISVSAQAPNAVVGQAFTGIVGTLTDQNPNATAADYTNSTIDWGDGTPVSTPTFQAVPNSPGTFNIIGTHTYTQYGTFNMAISAQDDNVSASDTATVYLPAPTISVGSVLDGVDETLEVPVSLSGNNVANQSLTIASYDSSIMQVSWENGGVTDANGDANLLVMGVGIGSTDIVIADAFGASGQGHQVVGPDTLSVSTSHLSVCSAGPGKQLTVSVSHPDGTPSVNTLLRADGEPDGYVQIDPSLIVTDNTGSVNLNVKGLHEEQGEGVVVAINEIGAGGAYGNFGVNVVPPTITIPSAAQLALQTDANGSTTPIAIVATVTDRAMTKSCGW